MTHYSTQDRNNVFIIIATAIFIVALFFLFSSLNTGSYIFDKKDLVKIDSVKMLTRAFMLTGKNAKGIEFEDENRKTFIITGTNYDAIADKSKLYDTLQYSELVMAVYTDKTGLENYRDKNNEDKIDVYNIVIGQTSFINLNDINKEEHNNRRSTIIFLSIAYCVALIYYCEQRIKIKRET